MKIRTIRRAVVTTTVTVGGDGFTRFTPQPNGRDRFLKLDATQLVRVREALVQLSNQPPKPTAK